MYVYIYIIVNILFENLSVSGKPGVIAKKNKSCFILQFSKSNWGKVFYKTGFTAHGFMGLPV